MNKPVQLQASKWLQLQALLDSSEMEQLLNASGDAKMYLVGIVTDPGEEKIPIEEFLHRYQEYISLLKSGNIPEVEKFRPFFSCALTLSGDHLFALNIGEGKQLIRIAKPVVQMQMHMLGYSRIEQKFRPMILGKDSIHWGIQFSYPQLYLDPLTKKVENVLKGGQFPNTFLYRSIQGWIRKHTLPTPFLLGDKRINVPMRLGKNCFAWINAHPQLASLGITVKTGEDGCE